jgi:cytochrome c biogenesis protein CcdA/thiol-disulfide isomerase/thioredoxin
MIFMSITLLAALFAAGLLTILLPCILPLVPIVVGVSISGKHRLRPLLTVLGMMVSFIGFTFLLQVALAQFVSIADILQIATYYVLLLFGAGFLTEKRLPRQIITIAGALFFLPYGIVAVVIAAVFGLAAMDLGGQIATRLQQLGGTLQQGAAQEFGTESPVTGFIIGLTLGLVWVPCAGPALGFALTLVRDQPGLQALIALTAYASGTAVPLLLVGYGGQFFVQWFRSLNKISGHIKHFAGAVLLITAVAFQQGWFLQFQTWIVTNTSFGSFGNRLEEQLFGQDMPESSPFAMQLPKIVRAPEFAGLGPWHNTEPFTLADLKGKVVLVDFWTYSCINCIRTLPYMEGYWQKYKDMPFVLLGVHTPEFTFEKSEKNVAAAIKNHKLTYPIAQDNDYATWTAFANRYWPAKYLIDADGYIRYTHFGEGDYDETDMAIASLLKEIGSTATGALIGADAEERTTRDRSPETYIGERSWPAFINADGDPDDAVHTYAAPAELPLNRYALSGDWQLVDGEYQVLRSAEGSISYHAVGTEVNLVLGLEDGVTSVKADVMVDGKKTQTITIDRYDLFTLYTGDYGEHRIDLVIHGKGVRAYAYTFGS